MEIVREAAELLKLIRGQNPLIHHITNQVTMNDSANIVLALGGSPIMANNPEEVVEVTAAAKALVLNLGTPNQNSFGAMLLAGKEANRKGIPIVIDPVGAGITQLRRAMCSRLLEEVRPAVIKGNLAEVMYLANEGNYSRGMDSLIESTRDTKIVSALSKRFGCVVAATGRKDIISDGRSCYVIYNGHELLSRITGAGCMTASLIALFCSVTKNYAAAAVGGIMTMGISGELAAEELMPNEGGGTFKMRLFDKVFSISEETFLRKGEVHNG